MKIEGLRAKFEAEIEFHIAQRQLDSNWLGWTKRDHRIAAGELKRAVQWLDAVDDPKPPALRPSCDVDELWGELRELTEKLRQRLDHLGSAPLSTSQRAVVVIADILQSWQITVTGCSDD